MYVNTIVDPAADGVAGITEEFFGRSLHDQLIAPVECLVFPQCRGGHALSIPFAHRLLPRAFTPHTRDGVPAILQARTADNAFIEYPRHHGLKPFDLGSRRHNNKSVLGAR